MRMVAALLGFGCALALGCQEPAPPPPPPTAEPAGPPALAERDSSASCGAGLVRLFDSRECCKVGQWFRRHPTSPELPLADFNKCMGQPACPSGSRTTGDGCASVVIDAADAALADAAVAQLTALHPTRTPLRAVIETEKLTLRAGERCEVMIERTSPSRDSTERWNLADLVAPVLVLSGPPGTINASANREPFCVANYGGASAHFTRLTEGATSRPIDLWGANAVEFCFDDEPSAKLAMASIETLARICHGSLDTKLRDQRESTNKEWERMRNAAHAAAAAYAAAADAGTAP